MKRYIKSVYEEQEDVFQPNKFDEESVDAILKLIQDAIQEKFGRRYKSLSVDFDDLYFDDYNMQCQVTVYNNNVAKLAGEFKFSPYSSYWDITDYQQHQNTTIQKFVSTL